MINIRIDKQSQCLVLSETVDSWTGREQVFWLSLKDLDKIEKAGKKLRQLLSVIPKKKIG